MVHRTMLKNLSNTTKLKVLTVYEEVLGWGYWFVPPLGQKIITSDHKTLFKL